MTTPPLEVDTQRDALPATGFYVRAKREGQWVSVDIAHLKRDSLVQWLNNPAGDGETMAVRLVLRWLGWP